MKRAKEKVIDKRVEVLLEVGSEEIPAGMLPKAEEDLRQIWRSCWQLRIYPKA